MDYRKLPHKEIEQIARTIHPGAWAIEAERPLSTLLGSCVAVCLFDPQSRIGGLNHFMLPSIRRGSASGDVSLLYGDVAMEALLNAMLQKGASKMHLQAKAFGGGMIFDSSVPMMDIGRRNATFAKEWLRRKGIPLVAFDLLGPWSRKVLFLPGTGDAFCRRMVTNMATAEAIAREERALAEALTQQSRTAENMFEFSRWLKLFPLPITNSLSFSA